jgi:protein-export membrane protein SecD
MFTKRLVALLILIIGGLLAAFVYYSETDTGGWWQRPFKLGLDLKGGSHLVYEADVAAVPAGEVDEAMSALRQVIERRINAFGVAEPVIQVEESSLVGGGQHRLIVELPGVTDLAEAQRQINVTPTLEFKLERPEGAEKEAIIAAYERAAELLADNKPLPNDPLLQEDPYFIPSGLTGRYLKRAEVVFAPQAVAPSISVEFTAEGADLFAEITAANVDKPLGIYLDGALISAPVVREAIRNGQAEISGQFTVDEARELARNLNLGALPVPIKLVATETVGPTLGAAALERGVTAGLVGLLAVSIFMLLWYRLPGLAAVISLSIYVVLILFLFKILGITITAAGIAGLILSFGMALDANILISERLKEELRAGRGLAEAVREGFARAWFSIRDANLASLVSAIVLFWFGTNLIKGFAVTLIIGLVVGLFTAIWVTRRLLLAVTPATPGPVAKFLFQCGFK